MSSDQQMQKLEETELRKADRTVGVNCNIFSNISSGVMRKFAVSQSFLSYLENYRKTNSNHFPVDDQEFKYSTLYFADSLYTCTCATPTFI